MALALVLTGPIVDAVAGPIGVGATAVTIWNIAKWPVLLVVVMLMFARALLRGAERQAARLQLGHARARSSRSSSGSSPRPLFAFYVANFGSYNKTYGTLGGMVALLVWMWISNLALLFGMQLNAERERSRELDAGVPGAEREIQLEPRDEPKHQKTT